MSLYEIINPSDHYTIECVDVEIAAVACVLLGEGKYAFDPQDEGATKIPVFLFGNHDAWFTETLGGSFDAVLGRVLRDRRAEVADALDSVLIGKRAAFLALAPAAGTSEYLAARERWHDIHRSSLNDIGTRAWRLAANLRRPVSVSA